MKPVSKMLAVIGLSATLAWSNVSATPASADWTEDDLSGNACMLATEPNFGGHLFPALPNRLTRYLDSPFDNSVSSVVCRPGFVLIAYDFANTQGEVRQFSGRTAYVGQSWDNRISSFSAHCT